MVRLNWKAAIYNGGLYICELATKVLNAGVFSSGKQNSAINEVLFYGGVDEISTKKIGLNNLFCIYYVIMHAQRSVDVCVPSFVSDTLVKSLVNAHQRNNIKVRVAIHHSADIHTLQWFEKQGIEVKVIDSSVKLEHEFILIDAGEEAAVAVLGSVDYETERLNCNKNATLLTSEPAVARTLNTEFERLWHYVAVAN